MPHFPEWAVLVLILLPVANLIYKKWKNNQSR